MNIEDIKNIAVCGAGTMGLSICQVFAVAGYDVKLYDIKEEALETALSVIETNLIKMVDDKKIKETKVQEILNNIKTTISLEEAVKDADYIAEVIIEKIEIKKEFFNEINKLSHQNAIIASNTSYLNIFEVTPQERKKNTVIAHWFAPPHLIPLVEVVKGEETDKKVVDTVVELLKKVGKMPIVINKFTTGFCVNRIQKMIGREVFYLLDNGIVSIDDLDLAIKNSIVPRAMVLGFVQRYDFTGLDLSAINYDNKDYVEAPYDNAPKTLFETVAKGDYGVKTGKGFYDYEGRTMNEVLKERDEKLEKVLELLKEIGTDAI